MAYNEVGLDGFLNRDPLFAKQDGKRNCCTFFITVPRDGYSNGVDYVECRAWEKLGEAIAKYKKKGDHVFVVGSIRHESYENWKRQDVYKSFVNCRKVYFLEKPLKAKYADEFFEAYPQVYKLYKDYVKENKKHEPDSVSEE